MVKDAFDFDIVHFPFVHIVPLIECIFLNRVCSHVDDFNASNKCLTSQTGLLVS